MTAVSIDNIKALGTVWSFQFYEKVDKNDLYSGLSKLINDFDDSYSRFKSNSIVSTLNKEKSFKNPSQDLIKMLDLGLEYYDLSNGVFNIATEIHQRAQGYDKEYSFTEQKYLVPKTVDLNEAILSSDSGSIKLHNQISIDLGGIGKGYLIDKLAKYLREEKGLQYFLINGGGDLYGTSNQGAPISIHLRHPQNQTLSIGQVRLFNSSVCGSSPFLRQWGNKSHIIDIKNSSKKLSTSSFVMAHSAVQADIMATILTLVAYKEATAMSKQKTCEFIQITDNKAQMSPGFELFSN